jgi:hypothetical protein
MGPRGPFRRTGENGRWIVATAGPNGRSAPWPSRPQDLGSDARHQRSQSAKRSSAKTDPFPEARASSRDPVGLRDRPLAEIPAGRPRGGVCRRRQDRGHASPNAACRTAGCQPGLHPAARADHVSPWRGIHGPGNGASTSPGVQSTHAEDRRSRFDLSVHDAAGQPAVRASPPRRARGDPPKPGTANVGEACRHSSRVAVSSSYAATLRQASTASSLTRDDEIPRNDPVSASVSPRPRATRTKRQRGSSARMRSVNSRAATMSSMSVTSSTSRSTAASPFSPTSRSSEAG